ncbi:MAG TPA: hypothetical protein VHX60_06975 [Acidobacteriaceae bacterium]|nr:hypothetical protein [Acidobacteriaceae bacterium]
MKMSVRNVVLSAAVFAVTAMPLLASTSGSDPRPTTTTTTTSTSGIIVSTILTTLGL